MFEGGYSQPAAGQGHVGGGGAGRTPARPGQEFVSKVELRLECRNLLNKDVMSKSDPCAVLYMFNHGRYEEVSSMKVFTKRCMGFLTFNFLLKNIQVPAPGLLVLRLSSHSLIFDP